ncbi:hypothetical protein [Streptomyces sp. CA-106131]|uniref:hypothetical protein n=1 Tax=Streptomyces sp. CA-106131 TaxID=3240045 RepID=UPI003D8B91C9
MAIRTSRELMAWQPPAGWRELSGVQRRARLDRLGMVIPLRPADWETLEHDQRMAYLAWSTRILHDTPEARAAKQRAYRKDLRAWWVLECWWILCLIVGLWLVWGSGHPGEGVGWRIVITLIVIVLYTMALFIPMQIAKPSPPQD